MSGQIYGLTYPGLCMMTIPSSEHDGKYFVCVVVPNMWSYCKKNCQMIYLIYTYTSWIFQIVGIESTSTNNNDSSEEAREKPVTNLSHTHKSTDVVKTNTPK